MRRNLPAAVLWIAAWTSSLAIAQEPALDAPAQCVRVLDPSGRPLAGAELRAVGPHGDVAETVLARCDAEGFARFPSAATSPDGRHGIAISRRGRATVVLATADGRFTDGAESPREPGDLGDVTLFPGVTMAGRVVDASGAPVEGARVVATSALVREVVSPWVLVESRELTDWRPGPAPAPWVSTRSAADGRFVLRGVPPAGVVISAAAPGVGGSRVGPLGVGDPIELTLAAPWPPRRVDGSFGLEALALGARAVLRGASELVDVAARALRKGEQRAPALRLHVVDDATGAAVDGVRAFVWWTELPDGVLPNASTMLGAFGWMEATTTLDGPDASDDQSGVLVVRAPGRAPAVQAVRWTEGGMDVEVRLREAPRLRGTVVDARDGSPVAGALVRFTEASDADQTIRFGGMDEEGGPFSVQTAADGSFELGDLPIAEGTLGATLRGRPASSPQKLALAAGQQVGPLELRIPRGATITGRLEPLAAVPGAWVGLRAVDGGDGMFVQEIVWGGAPAADPLQGCARAVRVRADGSFEFIGVPAGKWKLVGVPRRTAAGGDLDDVVLRTLDVLAERDLDLGDCDARALLSGRVFGQLDLGVGELPRGRVGVRALVVDPPADGDVGVFFVGGPEACSAATIAEPDGSFSLPLAPGRWRLAIVDLGAGDLRVATTDAFELAPGGELERRLQARCGWLRVRVEPADDAPGFVGQRIELVPTEPTGAAPPARPQFLPFGGSVPEPGRGTLDLRDGQRTFDVIAPAGPVDVALYADRHPWQNPLPVFMAGEPPPPAQKETVVVRAGERTEVVLKPPARQ
ncbi:MAG: carboxypeptidase regulatory-like domain-containing protein [Planctomycetes bacterium]|nr:carboxypeptidase regulatory-like domain-containing protein [Planctomycetota bacterium]